jgi:polyferredoxin
MPRLTLDHPYPRIITRKWFRWVVFGSFISVFIYHMLVTEGNLLEVGGVFVSMCVITSLIALPLGIATRPRAWCVFCPMGTLQDVLGKLNPHHAKASSKRSCIDPEK